MKRHLARVILVLPVALVLGIGVYFAAYHVKDRFLQHTARSNQKIDFIHRSETALMNSAMLSYLGAATFSPTFSAQELEAESGWGELPFVAQHSNSSISVAGDTPDASSTQADVVARRLGDYVFTCQTIRPLPPDLWIVVLCFDQQANRSAWPTGTVTVGLSDNTVRQFSQASLISELKIQNELRAKHGLAALIDPRAVLDVATVNGKP